jgi:hypothetical protein
VLLYRSAFVIQRLTDLLLWSLVGVMWKIHKTASSYKSYFIFLTVVVWGLYSVFRAKLNTAGLIMETVFMPSSPYCTVSGTRRP